MLHFQNSGAYGGSRFFSVVALLLLCSTLSCRGEPEAERKETQPTKSNPIKTNSSAIKQNEPDTGSGGFPRGESQSGGDRSKIPAPPVLLDAPAFDLVDQTGERFGADELRGHVWIANFMFTQCTATCPQQSARIAELQRHASRWPDWDRVRLVSISVDPGRDTVAQLRDYAECYSADNTHWKFLTGERDEIFKICKDGFKLPVKEAARDASTPITHSSRFALIDARLRIRGYYESQSDEEFFKMLAEMRAILTESSPGTGGVVHISDPPDVFDPQWLELRRAAQIAAAKDFGTYHDFQFADCLEASGIQFVNRVVADSTSNRTPNHYDHGNGLAAADVDGDGLTDLYFVNQVGGNELWRNLGGGRFENFTDAAGVALKGRVSVAASFADIDNDGDPDLFVTTTRFGNALFENDGSGRFRDVTVESGLEYSGHSSGADFFDYDRDGRLDLFLTNVGEFTTDEVLYNGDAAKQEHPYYAGRRDAFASHLFPSRSERSILYHNDGNNRFHDVSQETGLVHERWSGDATPLDLNDDGWIDLYVVNMQGNDEYYENVDGRKFECRSREVFPRSPWGAMGLKSFDYNNDGKMDLFVTNMHADMFKKLDSGPDEKLKAHADGIPDSYLRSRNPGMDIFGNAFYENQGAGGVQEISDRINAENYWPWGLSVGDLNADGYQDVFITSSMNLAYRYHVNSLLLNDRGQDFRDAEFILGVEPRRGGRTATPYFEIDCSGADAGRPLCKGLSGPAVVWGALGSRSSVVFDLDQDGDLDIVTNDFHSQPMVLVSNLSERNPQLRYLEIRLRGTRANRDGLGAKIQVTAAGRVLTQVHDGQSGYLSQSALPLYFGLGVAESVDRVSVLWPGGRQQVVDGPIRTNQQLLIVEE